MADRRRLASEYVVRDVVTRYAKSIVPRTFIDNDRAGRWSDPDVLESGDVLYRYGVIVEVCSPGSNVRINISRLEFYGETSGTVTVKIHDLLSGEELASEDITAVAGQVSGVDVNISVQAMRRRTKLFISTEEDTFYKATVTGGCSTCTNRGIYSNGMMQVRAARVLKTDAVKSQNAVTSGTTGGLSALVSVSCDHGAWVCEMKSSMALPLLYCLAREVFNGALYNFDRWGIKDLRKDDVKERRDEFEALYSKSMNDLYEWMPIPRDPACFVCNSRTSTGVILP